MIPKTLSASSLKVATSCLARWRAEYLEGGRQPGGLAANLGTSCHEALEMYVGTAIMRKTHPPTVEHLIDCYTTSYLKVMQTFDFKSDTFKEGERMMRVWHQRNDFDDITVLSTESKESFQLPYMDGEIKKFIRFNFICDRVDQIGTDEYCVVDYKSWRGLIGADEVDGMLQARVYALAYQIKFPKARRIWVKIDQLRGEEVGCAFTRDDNAETFRALKIVLQRIVDTPADAARETLNDECKWCIRKLDCGALRSHKAVGGTIDMNLDDMIRTRYEAQVREGANKLLREDMDEKIKKEFDELDMRTLDTLDGGFVASTTAGKGRYEVDAERLVKAIGVELALEFADFKKSHVENLKGDPRITAVQWKQIEMSIVKFPGKRGLTVKPKKKEEGETWTP